MQDFSGFAMPLALQKAVAGLKFQVPTPIQVQAIPIAMSRRDLVGCAQTGTGKTAAFGIPLVTRLLEDPAATGLILVPTRELAIQIHDFIQKLLIHATHIRVAILIGGASMGAQFRMLAQRPRIVIATPGRLNDHLQRRSVSLKAVRVLVLDEADRMLDMGFAPQLALILPHLQKDRQTLLFSATIPDNIRTLAEKFLNNPERVTVGDNSKPIAKIVQAMIQTTSQLKVQVLIKELETRTGSVLIFARTKIRTDKVAKLLIKAGLSATLIHGDRSQGQREKAIRGFRDGKFRILVATDIAARGIDIPEIAHVINFDLPQVPEDYIHRIGRTARAGQGGQSLCLVAPEEMDLWRRITRLIETGSSSGPSYRPNPRPAGQGRSGNRRFNRGPRQRR